MHNLTLFIRITILFLTTTLFLNLKAIGGMSYAIIPNKQTKCPNDFGNGLSFFFEQEEGYYETSEVEQVSRILKLDLSVFQDINYDYSDKTDIAKHWHDIDTVASLVDVFIHKIVFHPNIYKQVHHNPNRNKQLDEEQKIWLIEDTTERNRQLQLLEKQPLYFYPPDYGYLSKGRLLKDLHTLKRTLECYKKNGITKIRLEYS